MKKTSWLERVLWMLLLCALPVGASTLNIPNTFTSGTTISSSQMNGNFTAISSWANGNVDNSNIGAAGIYASQIVPTGAANATFGGTTGYTFTQTLTQPGTLFATPVATPTANAVWCQNDNGGANGLTCNVPGSSTNGYRLQSAGATIAQVNTTAASLTGTLTNPGLVMATPVATPAAGSVYIINDNAATKGMTFNVPSSSTNGYQFDVGHSAQVSFSNSGGISAGSVGTTGQIKGTCHGCSNQAYVPEVYNDQTGSSSNSAYHIVPFASSFVTTGSCGSGAACSLTSDTLSFTNDAPFTNGVIFCAASGDWGANNQSAQVKWDFDYTDFSSASINMRATNAGGSSISTTTTLYFHGFCLGY